MQREGWVVKAQTQIRNSRIDDASHNLYFLFKNQKFPLESPMEIYALFDENGHPKASTHRLSTHEFPAMRSAFP
jgi:hypothetical protein